MSLLSPSPDDETITRALTILTQRLTTSNAFTDPESVKHFLCLHAAPLPHELFAVMFLDTRNRLLAYEPMFRGTLNRTAVYPREVARRALVLNAAGVILHHNHPGGDCTPSPQDWQVTRTLCDALRLVDVQVLDHVITGGACACSLAELGWAGGVTPVLPQVS